MVELDNDLQVSCRKPLAGSCGKPDILLIQAVREAS